MGEPQGTLAEFFGEGDTHLSFTAPGRTLENAVLSIAYSVHSGLLIVIEWNIITAIIYALSVRKGACEEPFLADTVRQCP